jgi:hypothetical protein
MDSDFPYKNKYMPLSEVKSLFNQARRYLHTKSSDLTLLPNYKLSFNTDKNAKRYNPINDNTKTGLVAMTHLQSRLYNITDITDYFTEECRVKCKAGKSEISLYDFYQKNKKKIKTKDPRDRNLLIRQMADEASVSQCTNYKLPYLLQILKHFKPKKWLDMSAGWGDRLISAIVYSSHSNWDLEYVGVDPNPCLTPLYENIIKTLVPVEHQKNFAVIDRGAETLTYHNSSYNPEFDFIFTSPPFFVHEKYSDDENQSIHKFNTIDLWLHNFLFKTIDKSWGALKQNGHFAIYIEDKPKDGYMFIDKMIKHIESKPGAEYLGVLYQGFQDDKYKFPYFRPVYIFRKN